MHNILDLYRPQIRINSTTIASSLQRADLNVTHTHTSLHCDKTEMTNKSGFAYVLVYLPVYTQVLLIK